MKSLCKALSARDVNAHREKTLPVHTILPGHSLYFGVLTFNNFCCAGLFAPVWVYIFRCAFFWHLGCTLQHVAHRFERTNSSPSLNYKNGQCLGLYDLECEAIHPQCLTQPSAALPQPCKRIHKVIILCSSRTSASSRLSGASETGYTHSALVGPAPRPTSQQSSRVLFLWSTWGMRVISRLSLRCFMLCKAPKP